jgi:hypothetical protein
MKSPLKLILLFAISLAVLASAATWWVDQPNRVSERFVQLVWKGQVEEAGELLVGPSSMEVQEDGDVVVVDSKGGRVVVDSARLPFVSGHASPEPAAGRTWSDRIWGRNAFCVAATGFGQEGPREGAPVTLYLTAERGGVRIDRMVADSADSAL